MQFSDAFFLEADLRRLVVLMKEFCDHADVYRRVRRVQDDTSLDSGMYQKRTDRTRIAASKLAACRQYMCEVIVRIRKRLAQMMATDDTAMWRNEVSNRLSPAITALSNVYGSKIEIHPDLGNGPPVDDVLAAIHKLEPGIRDHGQYLTDLTSKARAQAADRLAEQYSLTGTLVNLSRRGDVRQLTSAEISQYGQDRAQHSVGDPFADAIMCVHARCNWADGSRNGGELFDYIGVLARSAESDLDPSVRDAVVEQLRLLDTVATRRELWEAVLGTFPQLAAELACQRKTDLDNGAGSNTPLDSTATEVKCGSDKYGLSPLAFAGLLECDTKTINRYARIAGVTRPGRGKRNHVYEIGAQKKIFDVMVRTADEALSHRAESRLLAMTKPTNGQTD